jgi:hypothetical protein
VGDDPSSSSVCGISESENNNYDGNIAMLPTCGGDFRGESEGVGNDEVELKGALEDKDGDSGDPVDNAESAFKDQEEGNGGDDEENEEEGYEDEESEDEGNGGER